MSHDFQADIDAIGSIASVSTLLDVVCRSTGMGFAAVARVTEDRWIACKVLDQINFGLVPGGELAVATTICNEIRQSGQGVVIDHVKSDEAFCGHPTPAQYGFQSYISMPIVRADGSFFGTLCAIDPRPAKLNNPETIGMFKLFAELIAAHLDAGDKLQSTETALTDERRTSVLREQFLAVLGHDIRNPLASIDAGAKLLLRTPLDDKATQIVGLIQGSVARMNELIGNVLDLARSRLGSGLGLDISAKPLLPTLEQVVAELRMAYPDRAIDTAFDFVEPVAVDHARLAQLLSNLLQNALTHGDQQRPVITGASRQGGEFELRVSNAGQPIPPDVAEKLFQPFFRGHAPSKQEGLGLGLYIASEIAAAHGGTLSVSSTVEETRFTFRIKMSTSAIPVAPVR